MIFSVTSRLGQYGTMLCPGNQQETTEAFSMDTAKDYSCPVDVTVEAIGGKWKPAILWQLRDGAVRFTELKTRVKGITQKVLTQQLRELETADLVRREVYMEMPLRVEYALTARGQTLFPVLQAMADWGFAQHPEIAEWTLC
jgi:DNA-binding HxlR family transcriptional regulator